MRRNAHWRISKVARVIAAEMYESYMTDAIFAKLHPNRTNWVNVNYHLFLMPARAALAQSLTSTALSENDKEEIIDALALDQTFIDRKKPRVGIIRA